MISIVRIILYILFGVQLLNVLLQWFFFTQLAIVVLVGLDFDT